jgi:hypothetical protein
MEAYMPKFELRSYRYVPLAHFAKLPKAFAVSKNAKALLTVFLNEDGEPSEVQADSSSADLDQAVDYFMKHCNDPKVKKFLEARMGSLI